nr:immunoglobulin heavy chain junction region [Macaca mulatta]MOV88768.1 immunoglobulin heavy chain junction region [Macaca mulatta]MOV89470.1 immunoglobulin heavy chain junction region [Macaca mulatta]MOV89905.1 immunoglobulin heavy chain junction region [Macaca mulatta]MOV90246.1 immunoglobulin heavy chain junction region [Macaca mulatta]
CARDNGVREYFEFW